MISGSGKRQIKFILLLKGISSVLCCNKSEIVIKYFSVFFLLFLFFNLFSCKDDPVIPPLITDKDTILLSVVDITHRSISLNIHSSYQKHNSTIRLYRMLNSSDTMICEFPIAINDTVIIDDDNGNGLLLNTGYSYYGVRIDTAGIRKDSSNMIYITTLDSTSHNYNWQEFLFGNGINDEIKDIWALTESDAWAVGGVYINNNFYGGFHWNGNEWLMDSTVGGEAIWGFSSDDIWVVGGGVFHYNGLKWNEYSDADSVLMINRPFTALWGTSSRNLYIGNMHGTVVHWDGTSAEVILKLDQYITDIKGSSEDNIWVLANSYEVNPGQVASFDGMYWTFHNVNWEYNPSSIYVYNKEGIYVAGDGLYYYSSNLWNDFGVNESIFYDLSGEKTNDLFAVGSQGKVYHYNGSNWKKFNELASNGYESYLGVYNIGKKVFIVGNTPNQGKILIGTRY